MASSIPQPPPPVTPGVPSQQGPSTPAPSSTQPANPTSGGGGPATNGNQHYSLRWNNHQSHVLHAFEALLQNESLVDCTLVCEDTSFKAHKVVLSACSPYFQKIFIDNSCKHPVIVLKDIRGWEVQCIIDFMYKGETSVPEAQLTCLIKAAESLKVRGLTSSDQGHGRMPPMASPMPHGGHHAMNGYHHGVAPPPSHMASAAHRGYSPSPAREMDHHHPISPAKIPHLSGPHSNQSSPMSLTNHQDDRDRHRASPGPAGSGPRRKQARPRRRSGDSVGNASLDLSKSDSPPLSSVSGNSGNNPGFGRNKNNSPTSSHMDEVAPENLSIRPSSSPAINLVKTETLMEDGRSRPTSMEPGQDPHRHHLQPHPKERDDVKHPPSSPFLQGSEKALYQPHGNGMHPSMREHEARAEALQALNFMAAGGGLPPHFTGHPLVHPPHGVHGQPMLNPSSLSAAISSGRPTSTPSAPSNSFNDGHGGRNSYNIQKISIDRSKMTEEEAFENAIDMIQTRQMGFRKAADFFSVSKWKLYKTARKRGIYAEIKKQTAAQQALTKVPSNVQHFADMGVYKQLKKKAHLNKDILFPHLPGVPHDGSDPTKVFKTPTNNNHSPNIVINNNIVQAFNMDHMNMQKKQGLANSHHHHHHHQPLPLVHSTTQNGGPVINGSSGGPNPQRSSQGEEDHLSDMEDDVDDENIDIVDADSPRPKETTTLPHDNGDADVEDDDEDRVLVINHSSRNNSSGGSAGEGGTASPDDEDSSREEDSA